MKPAICNASQFVFCVATIVCMVFQCNTTMAQDAQSNIHEEWIEAKKTFLSEIDKSRKDIEAQLESLENDIRNGGDVSELKKLNDLRMRFIESGEIAAPLQRENYDRIRKEATAAFTAKAKQLTIDSLQSREDAIAEKIDRESKELSNPLVADVHARWLSAKEVYAASLENAESEIVTQLEVAESAARGRGDLRGVETAKADIHRFTTTGVIPRSVSRTTYDALVEQVRERLKSANESLVRSLLMANRDSEAKEMSSALGRTINSEPEHTPLATGADARKIWKNTSYRSVMRHTGRTNWDERDLSGKLLRKMREVSRNDDYIELLLLDRQHRIRLYDDHADIYKDNRWQWVANGQWAE